MYTFATLDPVSVEANDAIFASGPVFGIEVVEPEFQKHLVNSRSPLPFDSNPDLNPRWSSKLSVVHSCDGNLPFEGATLATSQPSLSSIGSMAILSLRAQGYDLEPARERIARIVANADLYQEWSPSPLPTHGNPWPVNPDMCVLDAMVTDWRVSMAERVSVMEKWLLEGTEFKNKYREEVEAERLECIQALEKGEITHQLVSNDRLAVVEGTHPASIDVGYWLAPVVVLRNPTFLRLMESGEPYLRFTIHQFDNGFVNFRSALAEFNELEPGWEWWPVSGLPTRIDSRQKISSTLTTGQVVEVVERHFL